MSYFLVTFAAV